MTEVDAVEIWGEGDASEIVLLCEHASNHIPERYNGLGLPQTELQRHIAWDIGAAEVTRRLSDALGAVAFLGGYSRLLIDLNRPLESPNSIVTRSEATDIPGNINIDEIERAHRVETMFTPFHDRVTAHLNARKTRGLPTRIVSIHSFTPVYHGEVRQWHGGVLFDKSQTYGEAVLERLREPGLMLGANVPYQTSRDEDYGVPIHGDDRGIEAIMIEIRQDLISDPTGVDLWAQRLTRAL
ncbi:N-formylglutamate amidohydrolase [Asticcacaulis endophyticus]|uniref:N-formylglutamate amidohydrolase n=1 Tax=Asticcacaulis endophyticus TaxID=1395890 RepID=A0A918QCN8_9CAUL|nr:N-formylglutamate amidohydrolase [Asticcacaulis endophyticus]GGZ41728.1 N-formylglutamate amidohydrolase [Asticcacaulis endophyticus]